MQPDSVCCDARGAVAHETTSGYRVCLVATATVVGRSPVGRKHALTSCQCTGRNPRPLRALVTDYARDLVAGAQCPPGSVW